MAERLIPGVGYVEETGSAQRLIPGIGYVDETVSAGGGSTTIDLTAASFGIAANGVQPALRTSLSTASVTTTANSIQPKTTTNLGAASLGFTASQVTPSLAVRLGSAAISLTANAITLIKDTAIQLTAATLRFVANDLTVTFEGMAAAVGNWKRGLQSRRNKRNNGTFTKRR
jgi:hypothetical protein